MDIQHAIGQNLKELRSLKGLTLEDASRLTGVSRSMLGQIEKGEVNPTVSTMQKIAAGFKVSFSSIFRERMDDVQIVRHADIRPILADEGRYQNYPTFPFREDRLFETYQLHLLQGADLTLQPQMTGTEEYLTVFSGDVEITAGEQTFTLMPGDSAHFFADVEHRYRNVGETVAALSMLLYYNVR